MTRSGSRQPVEKWSRPELEDKFHELYVRYHEQGQAKTKLEKELKIVNGRLRRAVLNKEPSKDADSEETEGLRRQVKLLNQKIKALKHQLLTYTKPSAQATTISYMTARPSFRPRTTSRPAESAVEPSTVRSEPETSAEQTAQPVEHHVRFKKDDQARTNLQLVKLNKELREAKELAEVAKFEAEKHEKAAEKLRNLNESLNADLDQLREALHRAEHNQSQLETNARQSDQQCQLSLQACQQELKQLKAELGALRETNDKLIEESLNAPRTPVHREGAPHAELASLQRANRRLQAERARLKDKLELLKAKRRPADRQRQPSPPAAPRSPSPPERAKSEHLLDKLFRDVLGIVHSHMPVPDALPDQAKWQQMYERMYDELEKVRDMLAVESELNREAQAKKQQLESQLASVRMRYETELADQRKENAELRKQIDILNNQLSAIAGGDIVVDRVKAIPSGLNQPEMKLRLDVVHVTPTESVRLFAPKYPRFFICIEFFDFEISLTPVFNGLDAHVGHVTTYELVVSDLLIHFMETDCITLELFETEGVQHQSLGVGQLDLRAFLGPKASVDLEEQVMIKDKMGDQLATVSAQVKVTGELAKAFQLQKRKQLASLFIPLTDESEEPPSKKLVVRVTECRGVGSVVGNGKTPPTTYVTYQLLEFAPHTTGVVHSNNSPVFNDEREFPITLTGAMCKLLEEETLNFFVIEDPKTVIDFQPNYSALATASVPLLPLTRGQSIDTQLQLSKSTGEPADAWITVQVYWKERTKKSEKQELNGEKKETSQVKSNSQLLDDKLKETVEVNQDDERPVKSLEVAKGPIKLLAIDKRPIKSLEVVEGPTKSLEVDEGSTKSLEPTETSPAPPAPKLRQLKWERPQLRSPPAEPPLQHQPQLRPEPEPQDGAEKACAGPPSSSEESEKSASRSSDHSALSTKEEDSVVVVESPEPRPPQPAPRRTSMGVDASELSRRLSVELQQVDDVNELLRRDIGSAPSDEEESAAESDATYTASPRQPDHLSAARCVGFKQPLHLSIPPSETSSVAEVSDRTEKPSQTAKIPKTVPTLSEPAGPSNLRVVQAKGPAQPATESPAGACVQLRVGELRAVEGSALLAADYDRSMCFVEWAWLDFAREECQTANSVGLPRHLDQVADFRSQHTYSLDWAKVGLLRQCMSLRTKMKFVLVLEGHDQDEVDDLGEAYLDLQEVIDSPKHTITFFDVDMEPLAVLDIEVEYAPVLWRYFEQLAEQQEQRSPNTVTQ